MALNFRAAFNTLLNRTSASGLYRNYLLFKDTPYWIRLSETQHYFEQFHINPVLFSTIMIKARAYSNGRIKVVNRKTEEVEPISTSKAIPRKAYQLLTKPNPLQSTWEWLKQRKIFHEIAGNEFTYANAPIGFNPTINNTQALYNVWPQYMKYKLTGRYFEATKIDEIIKEWQFEYGEGYRKTFKPSEILHRNEANTDINHGLLFGRSIVSTLQYPISNINLAYESRNVIIRNRGMSAIISSARGDETGRVPMQQQDKESIKEEMKEYGTLEGQSRFFFTRMPIEVNPVDQDVRKLGLFEEIATDGIIIANAFGVPEILLKLYLSGATFENQEASVRRLYQDTIIPEANDDFFALNDFLGMNETDWEIQISYDHIPVLQESKRENAVANRSKSAYLKELFMAGAITHNDWLSELGMDTYTGGDLRIWEMDEEIRNIILNKPAQPTESESQEAEKMRSVIKELLPTNGHN